MLKNIDGTPALTNSEESSLGGAGGEGSNLSPEGALIAFAAVSTTAGSLITALAPSVILMSGAGASDIAAAALAVRSIPASILARTSGLKVRMVPRSSTSSGMMFSAVA